MYVRVAFWIRRGWVGLGYGFVCNCSIGQKRDAICNRKFEWGRTCNTVPQSRRMWKPLARTAANKDLGGKKTGSLSCPGEQTAQSAPLCASGSITYRPPKCIEPLESKHIPGTWYWLYSRSDGVMAGGPNTQRALLEFHKRRGFHSIWRCFLPGASTKTSKPQKMQIACDFDNSC